MHYPSGSWRGYWEQTFWGRQLMHNLVLTFAHGTVQGRGTDCIGAFTFQGEHDAQGHVTLVKQYLGKHQVLYQGTYDGEGSILGRWTIPPAWSGPFALSLGRFPVPAEAPIATIAADPPPAQE